MDSNEMLFLYELLMEREERGFLQAVQKDPTDLATRAAYHDFLLDKGRPQSAELILDLKFVPSKGTWFNEPARPTTLTSGSIAVNY